MIDVLIFFYIVPNVRWLVISFFSREVMKFCFNFYDTYIWWRDGIIPR